MRRHLSYGNVMSTLAVFVALGGSSYAAVKISGKDIRNNSVTGADVRNRSLGAKELKRGTLPEGRWLLLDESGDIAEQSGGFTVISKAGVNGQPASNPNVYIDAGESLLGHGLAATIAIQNKVDRTGDGTPDPAFAGDTAVGRCGSDTINCVPTDTNRDDVLVVRALASNGDVTSQSRRVYVTVTP